MTEPLVRNKTQYPDPNEDPYFLQPKSLWKCSRCRLLIEFGQFIFEGVMECPRCHGDDVFPWEDDLWHCQRCEHAFAELAIKMLDIEGREPMRLCPRCDSPQIFTTSDVAQAALKR